MPRRKKNRDECMFDGYDEDSFTLDYRKPSLPPKQALLPQSDVIFHVEDGAYSQATQQGRTASLRDPLLRSEGSPPVEGTSCPQRFQGCLLSRRGPGYGICVVMACPGPQSPTCFCTTTGADPGLTQGMTCSSRILATRFSWRSGRPKAKLLASSELFIHIEDSEANAAAGTIEKRSQGKHTPHPRDSRAHGEAQGRRRSG